MSTKESGLIDVGYPIYGAKFVNNKTIIVTGGGGEGNNGIPNKITAIKCSLKVSDKSKRLQKFREIVLPKNEDSPMCLDVAKDSVDKEDNFSVFVGCNQSTQLLKSMNINNNLRKYVFTSEEHLRFVDAAQLEEDISGEGVGEYPKIVCLSSHNSVGCLMTSRNPSVIYIFNPDLLELNFKFTPERDIEILDFHLSPGDDGKTLCYITSSSIETVSTVTGNTISYTNAVSNKTLAKYNLSKVRFIDDSNIILTASLKNGKGVSIFQYSIPDKKIVKQHDVSTRIKGITAMDISLSQNIVALAGNDTSITVLRLSDFKTIKTFTKLHSFAITKVAFSPSGTKLASVSAANTLHVMKIPSNYSSGKSIIGTLVHYIFMAIIACLVAIFLQKFYENGQLEQLYDLSSHYGQAGIKLANEYGIAGYQFVKEKIRGENVDGDDATKQYFKMDEWDENENSQSNGVSFTSSVEAYSTETTEIASTIVQSGTSSNDNIDIRDITKDIEEITKGNNINTETFFNDTDNYIEQSTIINAPNVSVESVIEYTAIETTELTATETDAITENDKADNVATKSSSILTENPDAAEEVKNDVAREDKDSGKNLTTAIGDISENEEFEEVIASEVESKVSIISANNDDFDEAISVDSDQKEVVHDTKKYVEEVNDSEEPLDDAGESVDEAEEFVDAEEPVDDAEDPADETGEFFDAEEPVDDTDGPVDEAEEFFDAEEPVDDAEEFYDPQEPVDETDGPVDDAENFYDAEEPAEGEIDTGEADSDALYIGDDAHLADSNNNVADDDEEQGSFEGEHDGNDDVINQNKSSESKATESEFTGFVDSAETLEPEQISRETKSSGFKKDDRPVEEVNDSTEEFKSLDPDQMNDASDGDLDSNEDAIDNIDDSRPADAPIIENDIEEEAESEIDDSRPADLPHADFFDERDIESESEATPDSHIVDDSTFDHIDVSSQTFSPPSISDHEIDSNESASQTSTTLTKRQRSSSNEESIVTKPFTSKLGPTGSSSNKVTTIKSHVTNSLTTKTSSTRPATIVPSPLKSFVSPSKSLSSKNPSKSKKVKTSEAPIPDSVNTAIETPRKTVLSSKRPSITSAAQSKIKNSTKSSNKKTRLPKKSLSKRLANRRTVKPKPTSQSHDEL